MILVIGDRGSIGKRYTAILRYLQIPYQGIDKDDYIPLRQIEFDKALICTPTETHYEICKELIELQKPFLCEKPLSKNVDECTDVVAECLKYKIDARIVSNYKYLFNKYKGGPIHYNYYNTGKDGMEWDLCQLIWLDPKITIEKTSPMWLLKMNDGIIPYQELEKSYVYMIDSWVRGVDGVFPSPIVHGIAMTKAVLEYR